jgi:hypothetical protein
MITSWGEGSIANKFMYIKGTQRHTGGDSLLAGGGRYRNKKF